ncbi:hypothetical protein AMS68_000327 [Peltaster fructicola]|uniref:4a-hydroxytetrahydrobiopterin dehydratase n=1 Tax=Peltaster fructicola TaxID=286661 RepID=A0A6H0XJX1_9PEZI|nr:hypothetical protein AMS68_000327 [Peltaster fructicola]
MLIRVSTRRLAHSAAKATQTSSAFSTSTRAMVQLSDLKVSSDSSPEAIVAEATALIDDGSWGICHDGKGLERSFKFKGFKAAWDFMNYVAAECKKQKHHPEWTNIYNQTRIRWTTHNPEGLSAKDTLMARFCDEAGQQFGEIKEARTDQEAKDWESNARDCCSVYSYKVLANHQTLLQMEA